MDVNLPRVISRLSVSAFIAALSYISPDSPLTALTIESDSSWKCSTRHEDGWLEPEFDDSLWSVPAYPYLWAEARMGPDNEWRPNPSVRPMWCVPQYEGKFYFRKFFQLRNDVKGDVKLYVYVRDVIDALCVNGALVCQDLLCSYPGAEYEVSDYLRRGPNVIGVVGTGGGRQELLFFMDIPGEPAPIPPIEPAFLREHLVGVLALILAVLVMWAIIRRRRIFARPWRAISRFVRRIPRLITVSVVLAAAVYCQVFIRTHEIFTRRWPSDLFPAWNARNAWALVILLGLLYFLVLALNKGDEMKGGNRKRAGLLFLGILATALFYRAFRIGVMPVFHLDEALFGLDALNMMRSGEYAVWSMSLSGYPTLHLYVLMLAYKLFGAGYASLKIVSITCGMLGVIAIFLFTREVLGERVALAAAFLLAVSRWHITYSRMAWTAIYVPLFQCLCFFFLFRALRTKKLSCYFFAGLFLAGGLYTYDAYRVTPGIIAVFIVLMIAKKGSAFVRSNFWGFVIMAAVFTVVLYPLASFGAKNPQLITQRFREVSVVDHMRYFRTPVPFFNQFLQDLLSLNDGGDENILQNIPGAPSLDFVTGIFFILGLVIVLTRIQSPPYLFLSVWFLMALMGVSLTLDVPHNTRAIACSAIASVFSAIALVWLLEEYIELSRGKARYIPIALFLLVLACCARLNYVDYFIIYARHQAEHYYCRNKAVADYVNQLDPSCAVFWDGDLDFHCGRQTQLITRLERRMPVETNFERPGLTLGELREGAGENTDMAIIIRPELEARVDRIVGGAALKEVRKNGTTGRPMYVTYVLPKITTR